MNFNRYHPDTPGSADKLFDSLSPVLRCRKVLFLVRLTSLIALIGTGVFSPACRPLTPADIFCGEPNLLSTLATGGTSLEREGLVHREFFWRSNRAAYSMSVDLQLLEFCRAQRLRDEPTEEKLVEAADYFERSGWPQFFRQQALDKGDALPQVVSRFIQAIPYRTSPTPAWLPIEVLIHGVADCDDRAVFAAALLHALGYTTAYLEFADALDHQRHATLGIVAPEVAGFALLGGNQRFVNWELTTPLGELGVNFHPDLHPVKLVALGR